MSAWSWFPFKKKLEQNIKQLQDQEKSNQPKTKFKVPEIRITSPEKSSQDKLFTFHSPAIFKTKIKAESKRYPNYSEKTSDQQEQDNQEQEFKASIHHLAGYFFLSIFFFI